MASLRRAISPMHRDFAWDGTDSRPNGGQISLSAPHKPFASPAIDPMDASPSRVSILSFFGYIPLITITSRFLSIVIQISPAKPSKTSEGSSKARVLPWRRLAFQFFLFFVFGFFVGFSPLGTMDSSAILPPRQAELSFDFNPAENELIIRSDEKSTNNSGSDSKKARKIEEIPVDSIAEKVDLSPEKLLIVVTPTYNRAFQAYYLNRLGHTLSLVRPPILWIVVEMGAASMETAKILRGTGVMYRHLVCKNNMTNIKDRGVHQRNTAIEHIRKHQLDGIVYFADDGNLYSLDLFYRLRSISRFGTWPVEMLAQNKATTILEGPVCKGREVVGWHTNEKSKILRRFHVDMSGFAFNSTILWDPSRWHRLDPEPIAQLDTMEEGFQETTFIAQLVEDESQMEGLPDGCSRIMSWHLHLENHGLSYPRGWRLNQNLDVVLPINHE